MATPTPAAPAPAVYTYSAPAFDARMGDYWDRRRTFGNVYSQPFLPTMGGWTPANQPVVADARVGDFWDRRRCFGNLYNQPLFPWSGQAPVIRLGDSWDRRFTFGNVYQQQLIPPVGPVGPALGYHYADSAYRVGTAPATLSTTTVTSTAGGKDHVYPFA